MLGAAWAGALGWVLLAPPATLVAVAAGTAVGQALPRLTLRRAATARIDRIRDEAPEVLDLLAVAVGCGLPLVAALDAAGRWSVGELPAGLRRAAADLGRGAGTAPALDRLLREHPTAELEAAVAILERSRMHGTPAAEPLRALAAGARHARARRAMEHAARAAPRVQLVAALLLVPAALCVLAAALTAGGFR
ncbi:MAG: type II secretion system F family protein, partial [Solirubrobacteraceae bacterium]